MKDLLTMVQGTFSTLDYMLFDIEENEKSVVATAPFGRETLIEFTRRICNRGTVAHKFGNSVAPTSFSSLEELSNIFQMSIAHSEWFISFADGSRGFLDFDDDLLIIFFQNGKSDLVSNNLKVNELYVSALRELNIIREVARSKEHILRFESFVKRALHTEL